MKFELNPFSRQSVSKRFIKKHKDGMKVFERLYFEKGKVYDTSDYQDYIDFEDSIKTTVFKLLTSQVSKNELTEKLGEKVKVDICKGCGGKVTGYTVPMFLEVEK